MSFFPDLQTALTLGPISIKWYGVLILLGALISYLISVKNIKAMGYPSSVADDLFFGAIIAGIIGARLWYVAFYDLQSYLSNPLTIFMTWQGGMAIQGGLVLGTVYAYIFLKRKRISFLRMADAVVPSILVAQAIGRWGNFFNQEAYGASVSESFFNGWPSFIKQLMYIGGAYHHPTFLYESLLNLLGFALITYGLKKFADNKRGDLMYAYLMWYGLIRFWVESLRTDSLMLGNFRMAQVTSIVFILVGILGKLGVFSKWVKQAKPVILFDLDGTLLDTEPLIVDSMAYTLKSYLPDLEITREMELSFLGPTLKETLVKYLPEDKIDEAFDKYRQHNREIHPLKLKPIEHAHELLKHLKEEGYTLGIVSSKKKDMVNYGLSLVELDQVFDIVVGYDEVTRHKPDPQGLLVALKALSASQDNAIYVGDTYTDIQAAHNAGLYSIAYLSHPERQKAILDEKPNATIVDLLEIETLLKEDHPWTHSLT